jgi:hypothetical protein
MNGVKVFSTSRPAGRNMMGETITEWLAAHPQIEVIDKVVAQSSDREFHCLSVILFYEDQHEIRTRKNSRHHHPAHAAPARGGR